MYKFPRLLHLHALVRISGLRNKFRRALTKLVSKKSSPVDIDGDIIAPLEPYKDTFEKQEWAFVENFFTSDVRDKFLKSWPKFYYFLPIARMTKSYDMGFRWLARQNIRPQCLDHHPVLEKIYDYPDSEEFAIKVTDFCGDEIPRARYSTTLTREHNADTSVYGKFSDPPQVHGRRDQGRRSFREFCYFREWYRRNPWRRSMYNGWSGI